MLKKLLENNKENLLSHTNSSGFNLPLSLNFESFKTGVSASARFSDVCLILFTRSILIKLIEGLEFFYNIDDELPRSKDV